MAFPHYATVTMRLGGGNYRETIGQVWKSATCQDMWITTGLRRVHHISLTPGGIISGTTLSVRSRLPTTTGVVKVIVPLTDAATTYNFRATGY